MLENDDLINDKKRNVGYAAAARRSQLRGGRGVDAHLCVEERNLHLVGRASAPVPDYRLDEICSRQTYCGRSVAAESPATRRRRRGRAGVVDGRQDDRLRQVGGSGGRSCESNFAVSHAGHDRPLTDQGAVRRAVSCGRRSAINRRVSFATDH